MVKAARNWASSRSQVTKESGKHPSAKAMSTLSVGESQSEVTGAEARRALAIKRLESLYQEFEIELLYMSQSVDDQGRPVGESRVSSTWPGGTDEWPGEDCRSLWQDTCDLVDAEFKPNEADGGLSAWLFSRTQQIWMPTGIQAVVNDPLRQWLDRLRSPDPTGSIVSSAMIVTSNPKAATAMDLLAVSSKADVLSQVLRKQCDDVKRCETQIGSYRRDLQSESKSIVHLRDMLREKLASQVRLLRIERSTLRHWIGDAEIILHYASALIPDELSKCRQLSARTWNRPDAANWDELERELNLISNRLKWLPAPCNDEVKTPAGEPFPRGIGESSKPVEAPAGDDDAVHGRIEAGRKQPALRPCAEKAGSQYMEAMDDNPSLKTDREAYDWYTNQLRDDNEVLPVFATWVKYVREYRAAKGLQKNRRGVGHETRSVFSGARIEKQNRTESDRS